MAERKRYSDNSSNYLTNLQTVLNKLRAVPLFSRLSEEEMRAVASLFQQTTSPAGQQFVWRGGTDTHLYIIRSGRVFARTADNIYKDPNEHILRDGWVFNQDSFLTGQPNEDTFEAMDGTTTVWRVPRDGFLALLQQHPTLRSNLVAPPLIAASTVTAVGIQPALEVQPQVMADHTRVPTLDAPFDVVAALQNDGPFKGLDSNIIQAILAEKIVSEAKQGELIVERGGVDTSLYIVVQGRLVTREATDKYVDKRKLIVNPGGTANDISFMTGRQNYETLEALNNLKLWVVKRDSLQAYLKTNPGISGQFQHTPEIKKILDDHVQHDWLQEGEVMMIFRRKHPWTLTHASWPGWLVLMLLVGANIVSRSFNLYDQLMSYQLRGQSPVWVAWIGFVIATGLYLIWHIYDWYNDFYAVTDRRVIHREEVKWVSSVLNEAPIEKLQNVTVNRKTLASAFLDVGDVEMDQVGSDAKVVFAHIRSPEAIAKQVTAQQHRISITEKASDRERRREQIRKQIELKDRPGDLPPAPRPKMNVRRKPWDILFDQLFGRNVKQWLGTWLPISRMVVGDDIVYRKHQFDLFVNAALPFAMFAVYFGGLAYAWFLVPGLRDLLFAQPFVFLVGLIGLFLTVWLVYMYEDWRNDFYVLGKDRVIDIDRKPFGISSQRSEASFDKIQGITTKSTGTLNQILGIGDVIIATGAAGNELIWRRVSNPETIQREISARIEGLRRKREEDKVTDDYRRWAEWLGIYDELARLHEREQLK